MQIKSLFLWHFARFALPLTYGRRYFRSTIKTKKVFLFCIVLTYSYLCRREREKKKIYCLVGAVGSVPANACPVVGSRTRNV